LSGRMLSILLYLRSHEILYIRKNKYISNADTFKINKYYKLVSGTKVTIKLHKIMKFDISKHINHTQLNIRFTFKNEHQNNKSHNNSIIESHYNKF
jgi:hypothetical protein